MAILDPALTSSLPPKLTATTGMDALTHAVEAHTSIQKNPVSDAFAAKAVELIAENLPVACRDGADTEARTSLALGFAYGRRRVHQRHGGHRACHRPFAGRLCYPARQAMMMLLPHCVRFNLDRGIHAGLYGQLLEHLAPPARPPLAPARGPRRRAFYEHLTELNDLYHREYGVPLALSELGVEHNQLVAHTARSCAPRAGRPCVV